MKKTEVESIFTLAGIPIIRMWELPNGYLGSAIDRDEAEILRNAVYRARRPWWLVRTAQGLIEIGWRKHVISIDWTDTGIKGTVESYDTATSTLSLLPGITKDAVTKEEFLVHAWSEAKAVEYLAQLAQVFKRAAEDAQTPAQLDIEEAYQRAKGLLASCARSMVAVSGSIHEGLALLDKSR